MWQIQRRVIIGVEIRALSALRGLFSTRDGPCRLLLPLPCPPAWTSPVEGLPGGLLEDSCGRRKRTCVLVMCACVISRGKYFA